MPFLKKEPVRGDDLISSVRAVMFHLGDLLAGEESELIVPFQAIDSQTDHVELRSGYAFRLPSPRESLSKQQPRGHLVSSSVRAVITPKDSGYDNELIDVLNTFRRAYLEAVSDLLARAAMP